MSNYRIIFSAQADEYIRSVFEYASSNGGYRFMRRLSKLDKDIDRLQYFPEIGKVLATNHLTGSKLRLIVSGKTLIMFVVNKERAEISIEFIYNKGFDYKTIVDKYL